MIQPSHTSHRTYGHFGSPIADPPRIPERELFIAILDTAWDELNKYRFVNRPSARTIYDDAYRWFMSRDESWPASFEAICNLLTWNAGRIRACVEAVNQGETRWRQQRMSDLQRALKAA